jgi:hypothetical protein
MSIWQKHVNQVEAKWQPESSTFARNRSSNLSGIFLLFFVVPSNGGSFLHNLLTKYMIKQLVFRLACPQPSFINNMINRFEAKQSINIPTSSMVQWLGISNRFL